MNLKNTPILKSSTIRVGLTLGDPAGIGPAIALKALKLFKGQVDLTVIGSKFVLAKAAKILKLTSLPVNLIDLNNVKPESFAFGSLNAQNGKASLEYLDSALELLRGDKIDCLVTGPISKEAIHLAGVKFSGHTEYLAKHTASQNLVMLLLNNKLRFSLVTRHSPLKAVCAEFTKARLADNISNTIIGLRSLFLIRKPKLVVCGINPHASDNGVIGTEEQDTIIPVVKSLKLRFKDVTIVGPWGADSAIASAIKGDYDCVIAAYHDQALIALKLTDFNSGVNLTLGLPFVRTSPLHGTAFDIAPTPDLANPGSLVSAVKLAIQCTLNQKKA